LSTAYRDLTASGVPTRQAAALTGLSRATMHRRTNRRQAPARPLARQAPANKIPAAERTLLLELMNSPEYVDRPPLQIYADLLDQGRYVGSVSTMYRVLGENQQIKERRRQARHRPRARPELLATGPGQVYTWDITKLAGPVKGTWYDAYVMIDIYSRCIVGAHVHATESGPLAVEMMREIFGIHGIPQVVHADRGTSMTSKTVTALLADLNVTKSHSRPKVSNDNPYSEAWFKTMKYAPVFPARFGSLTDARTFVGDFVDWYNHEHRHTGIGLHTPADVHYGHATAKAAQRATTLAAARSAHPERFGTTGPPKILALPETAWINEPPVENQAA
jgi:transposase InsO family protein